MISQVYFSSKTQDALEGVLDFKEINKVCYKALHHLLKIFPNAITQELETDELMALLIWKKLKDEPYCCGHFSRFTGRQLIPSVCHKFILDEEAAGHSFCCYVIACHMWKNISIDWSIYKDFPLPSLYESWITGPLSFRKYYLKALLTDDEAIGGLYLLRHYFKYNDNIDFDRLNRKFEDYICEYGESVFRYSNINCDIPDYSLVERYLRDDTFNVLEETIRKRFMLVNPGFTGSTLDMAIEALKKCAPKDITISWRVDKEILVNIANAVNNELDGKIDPRYVVPAFLGTFLPHGEGNARSVLNQFDRRIILSAYYGSCPEFYNSIND